MRAYRSRAHLVITLDTAGLLASYAAPVRPSPISSGSTLFVPRKHGGATFRRVAEHPVSRPVVELTVEGGVTDIAAHVVRLERWLNGVAQAIVEGTPARNPGP